MPWGSLQTTLCNPGSWEELALRPGCRGTGVTTIVPKITGNTGFKFRRRITPVLLKYFTRASKLDIIQINKTSTFSGFFPQLKSLAIWRESLCIMGFSYTKILKVIKNIDFHGP